MSLLSLLIFRGIEHTPMIQIYIYIYIYMDSYSMMVQKIKAEVKSYRVFQSRDVILEQCHIIVY